jgi:hypothetical protein
MKRPIPRSRRHAPPDNGGLLLQREVLRLVLHLPFGHRELATPVSHALEVYLAELMELAVLLPYVSGHAGLAFSSPNLWGPSMRDLHEEALRYPGLDVTHGQRDLGSRVDGVHWLNFLGPEVLTLVGGAEALRSRLHSPSTTVQLLGGGRAVVTLGAEPEAGDLLQGDALPAYRELARVLEPWLFPHPEHVSWRDCPPGTARRWWRRFLD